MRFTPIKFYTNHDRICRFRIGRLGFSSHKPDLSPDQASLDRSQEPPLIRNTEASRPKDARRGANRSAARNKGTSGQLLIASNALAQDPPQHAGALRPQKPVGDGITHAFNELAGDPGPTPEPLSSDRAIRTSPRCRGAR
jgi:hypothetical protein